MGVMLETAVSTGAVVTARSVARLGNRQQATGHRKSNNQKQKSHHYFAGVTVTRT